MAMTTSVGSLAFIVDILSRLNFRQPHPFRDVLRLLLHRQLRPVQIFTNLPQPRFSLITIEYGAISILSTKALERLDPMETSDKDGVLAPILILIMPNPYRWRLA